MFLEDTYTLQILLIRCQSPFRKVHADDARPFSTGVPALYPYPRIFGYTVLLYYVKSEREELILRILIPDW